MRAFTEAGIFALAAIVTIKLFAMTCGWLTGELGRLMEGGEGEAELPIPSYLIEHPRGTALFDTGLHPACQHDPAARVGPRLSTLFRFNYFRTSRGVRPRPCPD